MEMMGNESMIWEGHPTWRAMLSFHIKWFAAVLIGVNNPQDLREGIMHARDDEKAVGPRDGQGGLA